MPPWSVLDIRIISSVWIRLLHLLGTNGDHLSLCIGICSGWWRLIRTIWANKDNVALVNASIIRAAMGPLLVVSTQVCAALSVLTNRSDRVAAYVLRWMWRLWKTKQAWTIWFLLACSRSDVSGIGLCVRAWKMVSMEMAYTLAGSTLLCSVFNKSVIVGVQFELLG